MYDIVTIGSAVLDITMKSNDLRVMKSHEVSGGVALCEVYGGKSEVSEWEVGLGGGATNSAVSFLKKGLKVGTIAKVADDSIGGLIMGEMERWKIDQSLLVKAKEGKSGMSVVLVAPDGGRSILTYRGVSKELTSADIEWGKIKGADWLYVSSLGGEMSLLEDIVSFADKEGVKVAVNPGKGEIAEKSRLLRLIPKMDVVIVNRMEACELLGLDFEDEEGLVKGVVGLAENTVVAVSEGRRGSRVVNKGVMVKADAFGAKVIDETGAGDAFGSGLVFGLLHGRTLAESLKAGTVNAAGEISAMGVKDGLLTTSEMAKWMKKELRIVEEKVG